MAIFAKLYSSKGSENIQGPQVTETWVVWDDTRDACNIPPIKVLALTGLPKVGMPYDPADCDDPYNIIVNQVNMDDAIIGDVDGQEVCMRYVTVEYGPDPTIPQGQGPGTPNFGQPDPLLWTPTVEINSVAHSKIAEKLLFIGAYLAEQDTSIGDPCAELPDPLEFASISNSAIVRDINTIAPVANSVGELFNPPVEVEYYDQQIRITTYLENWDPDDIYECFRGSINHWDIRLAIASLNYDKTYKKHTLWLKDITGRPAHREWKDGTGATLSRQYWAVSFEIMHRRSGWYLDLENVGTKRIAKGDDSNFPDGFGGVWDRLSDFPQGVSVLADILDVNGRPVETAQYLNLDGQTIVERPQDRQVLRYLMGWEMDFTTPELGLPLHATQPPGPP